jgi:predicted aconitase with swiveling domain
VLSSRVCGSVSVLPGGGGTSVGRDVVAGLAAKGGAGEEGFGLGRGGMSSEG